MPLCLVENCRHEHAFLQALGDIGTKSMSLISNCVVPQVSIIGIGVGIPAENVQVVQIKKVLSELNNKRIDMELDIRVLIGEICTRWEKRDLFIGLAKSISYQAECW